MESLHHIIRKDMVKYFKENGIVVVADRDWETYLKAL